ncbi:MAG: ABC transporter ATP-binding protein [Chloroflexi bacterium]|nr:ABC transporter ATP-binding protein [Chloroflexota bacterium]
MSFIIRAENIGKKYYITRAQKYRMARDVLANAGQSIKRTISGYLQNRGADNTGKQDELWALRNVDFEIQPGQSVGIIGKNGAGKSTLLKILSRITTPSEGRVRVRGRVGSLLEVGTGFHPELTGRENVYLNGAILGMKKAEIDRSFDEIVAFSETEAFLDTPVKFFSSGMRMRLAFSVAAHLDPEILLIDEILAVGDIAFQRKSLAKMNAVASSGRTILFISHSMAAIKSLCQSAILLNAGKIVYNGNVEDAIDFYTKTAKEENNSAHYFQNPNPHLPAQITSVELLDTQGLSANKFGHDNNINIRAKLLIQNHAIQTTVCLNIYNANLDIVIASYDFESDDSLLIHKKPGEYIFEISIPGHELVPGEYSLGFEITQPQLRANLILNRIDMICHFEIYDNGSDIARLNAHWRGLVHPQIHWKIQANS